MFLRDIEGSKVTDFKIGSTIFIVRNISQHVEDLELVDIPKTGKYVIAKCRLSFPTKYKLFLEKNQVYALECGRKHRDDMKRWWYIWEPHREHLLYQFFIGDNALRRMEKEAKAKQINYRSFEPPEWKPSEDDFI